MRKKKLHSAGIRSLVRKGVIVSGIATLSVLAAPVAAVTPDQVHAELERMRDTSVKPPEDLPQWTMWDRTQHSCSRDPLRETEAFNLYKECLKTLKKTGSELWDPFYALSQGDLVRLGRESAEAAGTVFGAPFEAIKCKSRAEITANLQRAGAPQSEIDKWQKKIDVSVDVVSLVSTVINPVNQVDLAGAFSKTPELYGQAAEILTDRIESLESELDKVNDRLNQCKTGGFDKLADNIRMTAREHLVETRQIVTGFEKSVYCDAVDMWPGSTAKDKIEWSSWYKDLKKAHQAHSDAAKEVVRVERRLSLLRKKVDIKLKEQQTIGERIKLAVERKSTSFKNCATSELHSLLADFGKLRKESCTAQIGKMTLVVSEFHSIRRALDQYKVASQELLVRKSELDTMISTCRYQAADGRLTDLERVAGIWDSSIGMDLSRCPAPFQPWRPGKSYRTALKDGRTDLNDRKSEAKSVLEQASHANDQCDFETAWDLIGASRASLEDSRCTINPVNCEADTFDPSLCRLVKMQEQRADMEQRIVSRQADYDAAASETDRIAGELNAWAAEQMTLARAVSPGRCAAISQLSSIASDLDGLRPPLDCPGNSPYTAAANNIRQQLEEVNGSFRQQLADLSADGSAAFKACDEEALSSVIENLVSFEAAACPPNHKISKQLGQELQDLEKQSAETAEIIRDAQKDWHHWMQSCDTSLLNTTEARASLIPDCGYKKLKQDDKGRVSFLREWGKLAPGLVAKVNAPEPHIQRAQELSNEARQRIARGISGDVELQAVNRILEQARAAIQSAREAASGVRESNWIPALCGEKAAERIASVESSLPTLNGVPVPDLGGQSEKMAVAILSDLGFTAAVSKDHNTKHGNAKPGTVVEQVPLPGRIRAPRSRVLIRIYAPPKCPPESGTAWSKVHNRCISLTIGNSADTKRWNDCRERPGTMLDPATGKCRCTVGEWDGYKDVCVDTAASKRQKSIEDRQKSADCEGLYSKIQVFRNDPSPVHRQMAASAEQRAQQMQCDPDRISDAITAAEQSPAQPPGGNNNRRGRTMPPEGRQNVGSSCIIQHINRAAGNRSVRYLAYFSANPARSSAAPDAYGVLTVPSRLVQGGEVVCRNAIACLDIVEPRHPFQIINGREHTTFGAAENVIKGRCPNPVRSGSY